MKDMKYIKANNLPPQLRLSVMLVWWLALDRFGAPAWAYGVVFTLLALVFIHEVVRMFVGKAVDVLGNDRP